MADDFIEEIKEDVRNDQLVALWKDYGNVFISLLIAIVLGTIGYLFWHNAQEKKLLDQTLAYEKNLMLSLQDGQKPDYRASIEEGSLGYKIMGIFEQARAEEKGQNAENLLKSMAEDSSVGTFYRSLADLQRIMRQFDSTNGKVLLEELDALVNKVSPLQPAALELQGFAHLKLQNLKAARHSFVSVGQHPQSPQSMKVRARAMIEMLTSSK